MKFLLDANVEFRLASFLSSLQHDVKTIARDYPSSLADHEVLALAVQEQRILLTNDRDFGELIFQQGLTHAGVIFFRLPGAKIQTKIDQLNTVLTEHTDDLEHGEFLVVTPGQIRIAGHPRA